MVRKSVKLIVLFYIGMQPPHHGKVKFGSLMGALKLVRTSSKLAHFDA